MNKNNQNKRQGKKATGYTWVSKAGSWQVYQHNNNGSPDKIEWLGSEEDCKKRIAELTQNG